MRFPASRLLPAPEHGDAAQLSLVPINVRTSWLLLTLCDRNCADDCAGDEPGATDPGAGHSAATAAFVASGFGFAPGPVVLVLLFGRLREVSGSYDTALYVAAIGIAAFGVLLLCLGPRPKLEAPLPFQAGASGTPFQESRR